MTLQTSIKKLRHAVILSVIGLCQMANAAELNLHFSDAQGKPLEKVVAALVAEAPMNYNDKPTAIMDQRDNMFVPGVLAIRTNTLVRFPNSDDVRHHVYSFSPAKKFELRLYHGMTAEPVLFDQPGKVVLGCNIHDSMVAHIYVVNSEYFSLSDSTGSLQLKNIPSGKYTLEIYHPKLRQDYPAETVTIKDQDVISKAIQLHELSDTISNKTDDEFSELFQ